MNIRLIISLLIFVTINTIAAQNVGEGVRHSLFETGVTARALGVGGSLGALGADYSSVLTNPAGIAWNRSSQLQISPAIYLNRAEAMLEMSSAEAQTENNSSFLPGSIGLIIHNVPGYGDLKSLNFGVGFSRVHTRTRSIAYRGTTLGTIGDYYATLADGFSPEQLSDFGAFDARLAWDAYLISLNPDVPNDFDYIDNADFWLVEDDNFEKSEIRTVIDTRSEINLAAAANYKDQWMWGASLNLVFTKFDRGSNYNEFIEYAEPDFDYVSSLSLYDSLRTDGFGVNLRLGAIYRASQSLRLGATLHTPHFTHLKDQYTTDLDYFYNARILSQSFDTTGGSFQLSPIGQQKYGYSSPWRLSLQVGYLFGKKGFLTTEATFINYPTMNFDLRSEESNDLEFEDFLDEQERALLRSVAVEWRLGGELRVLEKMRLRAGIHVRQSPYADISDLDLAYSGGLGYDSGDFFLDAACRIHPTSNEIIAPYPGAAAAVSNNSSQIMLTGGVRF